MRWKKNLPKKSSFFLKKNFFHPVRNIFQASLSYIYYPSNNTQRWLFELTHISLARKNNTHSEKANNNHQSINFCLLHHDILIRLPIPFPTQKKFSILIFQSMTSCCCSLKVTFRVDNYGGPFYYVLPAFLIETFPCAFCYIYLEPFEVVFVIKKYCRTFSSIMDGRKDVEENLKVFNKKVLTLF